MILEHVDKSGNADRSVEFVCSYSVSLSGGFINPEAIAFDWSIAASTGDPLSVQLLAPGQEDPFWGDPGQRYASASVQTGYRESAADSYEVPSPVYAVQGDGERQESFSGVAVLRFGLRLIPDRCSVGDFSTQIAVTGNASIPGDGSAVVSIKAAQPVPVLLVGTFPAAIVSAPVASISSITIPETSFALTDRDVEGLLTIAVVVPEVQCQVYQVLLSVATPDKGWDDAGFAIHRIGETEGETPDSLEPVTAGIGQSLTSPIVVAIINRDVLPGHYTQTIEIDVVIPGGLVAGAYSATAAVTVETRPG